MKSKRIEVITGGLILNSKNQAFFGHHKKMGAWVIPGGHVEFGESFEEALAREIQEELGVAIYGISYLHLQESIQADRHFVFINFIARTNQMEEVAPVHEEYTETVLLEPHLALEQLALNDSSKRVILEYLASAR